MAKFAMVPERAALIDVDLRVVAGYSRPRAVCLAVGRKPPDAVTATTSVPDVWQATGTNPKALRQRIRALISLGYFSEEADGAFTQTSLLEAPRLDGPTNMCAVAVADLGRNDSERYVGTCLVQSGTVFECLLRKLRR